MRRLILLRHGESQWNADNRFTGWADVDLTSSGEAQAEAAGKLLRDHSVDVETALTSMLTRAIRTLWIVLHASDQTFVPEGKDYLLNERHYGALTGMDKDEAAHRFGADPVARWRRGLTDRPPPMAGPDHAELARDRRYRGVAVPRTENLYDVMQRISAWRRNTLAPALAIGTVLVVAHGNSLRALLSLLLTLAEAEIMRLEIPHANPLMIRLDTQARPIEAAYLDPARAAPLPWPS
ncbi:MAG: 2,3-diphosphoglycerate-dependent phosphoglycerate mutase [Pseudomonadota bacterium]|uniref:2,3-bisphosphoglycerate-dependent phosphoglycerate mutase n=1 Tax=Caulobacter sp. CCH9-E1 TaxID=1768768 RepID=UPI000831F1BA|nr:2,3-diphosphoglycerate-dependent phosphoglycerate mutase [Caulobacter sp. CCH9-E1]